MLRFLLACAAGALVFGGLSLGGAAASASECDEMRLSIDQFWSLKKGQSSGDIPLTPMALTTQNAMTTMPQLGVLCRKDANGGTVSVKGDGTEFNGTLSAGECRLVFLGGIKTINMTAGDDLVGEEACGSFDIIR